MKTEKHLLKVGDEVNIYEFPMECRKLEGRAILLEPRITTKHDNMGFWKVRFLDEPENIYYRWVNEEKPNGNGANMR